MATTGENRRRTRSAKAAAEETASEQVEETTAGSAAVEETVSNAVKVEETMAEQTKTGNGDASKPGKLELSQKPDAEANGRSESGSEPSGEHGIIVHAQGSEEIEIAESFTSAGLRPIGASHLEIIGTILKNRPIMASHLRVMEYSIPGHRPVFASEMIVRDDLTLPGGRPIMASDPHLLEASMIMGGRPIASNDTEDGEVMMGFLD